MCHGDLCLYYGEAKHTTQHHPKKQCNHKMRSIVAKEDNVSKNKFLEIQYELCG